MKTILKKIIDSLGLQSLLRFYHALKISIQNININHEIKKYAIVNNGKIVSNMGILKIIFPTHKYVLRKRTSDLKVFKQLVIEKEYQCVIDLISKHHVKINTVIDAGANVGLSMIFFKSIFPNVQIICIEPDKENCGLISTQIKENGYNNIYIEKAGLWFSTQYLEVKNDFRDGAKWSLRVAAVDYETELKGISLKYLIDKYNLSQIDLLKIDIEGSEKVLFENNQFMECLSVTKIICIEVHEEFISKESVKSVLKANNFECYDMLDLIVGIRL